MNISYGPRESFRPTGAVHLCGFLGAWILRNIAKLFKSSPQAKQLACFGHQNKKPPKAVFYFGARERI